VVSPFSWAATETSDTPLAGAYAAAARLARKRVGSYHVATRLLPVVMRGHVSTVHAFARSAMEFAHEGDHSDAERECLLDDWLHRLRAAARGESGDDPSSVFAAIGHTIVTCQLPVGPYEAIIGAFRQDVLTKRYARWADLLDYCRRSANPVGRLVLRIAGYDDEELLTASDAMCTALRLTSLWQNLARDWKRGRLYVPQEDLAACGASETDLDSGRVNPAWRAVLTTMAGRTRALYSEGRAVCDGVTGRFNLEARMNWLGGMMVLDRLERSGFDVFGSRTALRSIDVPLLLWRTARWRLLR
jgi:squalene synthase HpnC